MAFGKLGTGISEQRLPRSPTTLAVIRSKGGLRTIALESPVGKSHAFGGEAWPKALDRGPGRNACPEIDPVSHP